MSRQDPHIGLGPERFGYRPSKPTGKALPSGPIAPLPDRAEVVGLGKVRNPATAANMATLEAALAPRRWKPPA